jgi:asparagine synthase (glutamine-hydrolysing)
MITRVTIKEDRLWKKFSKNDINVFYKGYFYSHTISEIVDYISSMPISEVEELIKKIDGHFALVIIHKDMTIVAVDKIRSTPLFFTVIEDTFFIDCDPKRLISNIQFVNDINESAALEISMSGYTIGNKTIFDNLNALRAGEFAVFSANSFEVHQYFKYYSNDHDIQPDYLSMLTEITIKIFKKMLISIGNRQIIVPLSAGNDSRLVASILKELGHENVICYSYGLSGNFEAKTAKLIAEKLKYKWIFIPLVHQEEKKFYKSKEFEDYLKFSETFCSVPYIQSLSTVKYLKESNIIEDDAVFINGNSGDFISGLHLNYLFKNNIDSQNEVIRKEVILNSIFEKHFSLWGELSSKVNTNLIKKSLWSEIEFQCGSLNDKKNDYSFYECSEFIDRQSKYVISGQRAYEFYGYEWRLPLWDNEYLDYWLKVPINLKKNQSIYKEMLKMKNFGNVWSDEIPINHKIIKPRWLIPIRFLFKIPFALFGQKGKKLWHEFETIFFYYWMDNTRMMSTISYFRVLKSILKKPQNHVSWQAIDYIRNIHKK